MMTSNALDISISMSTSFSCAYASVERVASENSSRQISGFILLMFLLMLMFKSRLF